jgi:hypothetical protein
MLLVTTCDFADYVNLAGTSGEVGGGWAPIEAHTHLAAYPAAATDTGQAWPDIRDRFGGELSGYARDSLKLHLWI